ncbi:MAG: PadR family transcriptional regulator [Candidatus Hodarchaeota archaeon]
MMTEKIVEKFENAMKSGFISSLILIVLEKNPSYGYKIGKEIEKRTIGIWDPPSSTLYTVLKDMTKKQLITYKEQQVEGRNRKIYEITPKGKTTLKLMLEKHKIIEESFETLKTALLGDEKGALPKGFHKIGPLKLMLTRLDKKPEKEQVEFLELQKLRVHQDMKKLQEQSIRIEENIEKLKEKLKGK